MTRHLVVLGADDELPPAARTASSLASRSANPTAKVLTRLVRRARDQRRKRARIDAAGEKHAERHVAHQVTVDRCLEQSACLRGRRRIAAGAPRSAVAVASSAAPARRSPGVQVSTWPGSSFRTPSEEGALAGDEARRQELGQDALR